MATFSAVLVDVSSSMKGSIGYGSGRAGERWADSVPTVINDIVAHDVSSNNRVLAIGIGANYEDGIIDILRTIKMTQDEYEEPENGASAVYTRVTEKTQGKHNITAMVKKDKGPATGGTISSIMSILERNGASSIRTWTNESVICSAMNENRAQKILQKLRTDSNFIHTFVYSYLPSACRNFDETGFVGDITSCFSTIAAPFVQATRDDSLQIVCRAKCHIKTTKKSEEEMNKSEEPLTDEPDIKVMMCGVNHDSVISVHEAQDILQDCVGEKELSAERSQKLLEMIEPYIYGGTPLYSAISQANDLFLHFKSKYRNHHKLMFVLSDGEPNDDESNFTHVQSQLRGDNVTIVSCYITRNSNVEIRRLYDTAAPNWEDGAKFLFDLSSTVPTEVVTRALFIKQGWKIEIDKNATKLFVHVNNPDQLKDACELARNAVCCQDALCDLLATIDLDIYLNQQNASMKADQQKGKTCYANAAATVLHLSMRRILGRDCYPEFTVLRDTLIERYGRYGADTLSVLQEVCAVYRLRCREVDVAGAMQAITEKRPVVARFRLTEDEWKQFDRFYRSYPKGILNKSHLDIQSRKCYAQTSGHAVVLTSYNSRFLHLMNSQGDTWGDKGFFNVENAEVLDLKFIDIYWDLPNLTPEERQAYDAHGSEVAAKLMKSLKGLQEAIFKCPSCGRESKVTEFQGTLSRARCPRCNADFKCDAADGNILALNMHLASLSAPENVK